MSTKRRGRPLPKTDKAIPVRSFARCKKCDKNGHDVLLWHWRHGMYCVSCIREMVGIVTAFTCDQPNIDARARRDSGVPF